MGDNDGDRLRKLVEDLASDPGYASGQRKFPWRVSLDDAAAIAEALHEQVDQGVEARSAQIAAQGMVLACKRGCNGCCEEPIMVFRPEAARVARWLEQPEHADARAAFLAAYPDWKRRAGGTPAKLSAALFSGEPGAYEAAHAEGHKQGVLCAFNQNGDCTIYPVRPTACRIGHALDTSEHCNGSSPRPAARASFVPLSKFVSRARALLAATHNAARGPKGRIEALCNAVYDLLDKRAR